MPEFVDGPKGKFRVTADLTEPMLATVMSAQPRGLEVEITFYRKDDPELGRAEDGSIGEVVARMFMPRENFEKLVGWLPGGLAEWRRQGL